MTILCKLWGHKLNEEAAYYYSVYHCDRCGDVYEEDTGLRERLRIQWWRLRQATAQRWHSLMYWLKCSECGLRFGKHDDSDHLPF